MFKLHKPHLSGSIHSGHFMVSRLDDDDEDNNDPGDDSSESERDNANSVEIDVSYTESAVEAANNLDLTYRVDSPSTKKDQLTSWNDLDKPAKHSSKQNQYLTYYTNSYSSSVNTDPTSGEAIEANSSEIRSRGRVSFVAQNVDLSNRGRSAVLVGSGRSPVSATSVPNSSQMLDVSRNGSNNTSDPYNMNAIAFAQDQNRQANLRLASFADVASHQHNLQQQRQHLESQLFTQSLPDNQQQQQQHQQNLVMQRHLQPRHAVTIDTSLTKLFETMSLYYSSNLTSPKWKSFKGLKLRLKNKIRLNNLIWRTWFLQYIRGRRPPGCQFTAPVETDIHKKSETVVLEGKYWKRKEKAIVDEYKKWRIFHKQKCQMHCFRPSSFDWDSRVSNLASSSLCGPEYQFYSDYDMSVTCNLDYLPPMVEEPDTRQPEQYYQPQPQLLQPQLQQQQQQQQQQHHYQSLSQSAASSQTNMKMIEHPPNIVQQQQQQQSSQILPTNTQHNNNQQQQQQQLTQLQIPNSNSHSHQAISLKRQAPQLTEPSGQHHLTLTPQQQQHINHSYTQSAQSHSHLITNNHTFPLQRSISFGQSPEALYQQHPQLAEHQSHSISPPLISQNLQQQLNLQDSIQQDLLDHNQLSSPEHSGSIGTDVYSLGGSGGGRNEQRRVCHINAEQKRRCNIKNGFDTLKSILPTINQNANVKISKASMLQKAAVYISALSSEQKQQLDEQNMLKQQIENLKQSIRTYQCQLPASGGPVGCPGSSQAREMLQTYVKRRTLENWKFWIFSLLIEPLFETYYNSVSTTSLEDACKTIFTWLDRNCGLVSLRKDALESLTFLSTSTNILNTPQTLPTEAIDAVRYPNNHENNSAPLLQSNQQLSHVQNSAQMTHNQLQVNAARQQQQQQQQQLSQIQLHQHQQQQEQLLYSSSNTNTNRATGLFQ